MVQGFVVHAGAGAASPGAGGSVLASEAETNGEFSLLLSHAPAGDQAPLHVHDRESESFFVLASEYRIRCGSQTFVAKAGDFVYLPRGVPHAWEVTGESQGSKLILTVPGGIESFFEDLVAGMDVETLTHSHGVRFLP